MKKYINIINEASEPKDALAKLVKKFFPNAHYIEKDGQKYWEAHINHHSWEEPEILKKYSKSMTNDAYILSAGL